MVNILKQKIEHGDVLIGPFMKLPSPAVVEIMGLAGFDFVIIDCEHGPLNMLEAEDMIRAAKVCGIGSVIRVTENNPAMISRALDIGVDAVQVPQISTRKDAESVVMAAKFSPLGERGVCRYVRAAGYTSTNKGEYFDKANKDTMVIIHIEGKEGIDNMDDILEVEGIDIVFIGPYDLSQSLGLPGEVNHPLVEEKMREVIEKSIKKGKWVGTFVDNVDGAYKWRKLGVNYISYAVDVGIIYDAAKNIINEFKNL